MAMSWAPLHFHAAHPLSLLARVVCRATDEGRAARLGPCSSVVTMASVRRQACACQWPEAMCEDLDLAVSRRA